MEQQEWNKLWASQNKNLQSGLKLNKDMAIAITLQKIDAQMQKTQRPMWTAVLLGIPYTLLLIAITTIGIWARAPFVAIGFGCIAILTILTLTKYFYHLHLIAQVKRADAVLPTQKLLSRLKISSYQSLHLAIFQLPFWSVCWMSLDAVKEDPALYGGVHLIIFVLLAAIAFWMYHKVKHAPRESKLRQALSSGPEWDPIFRSEELLAQIAEYQ